MEIIMQIILTISQSLVVRNAKRLQPTETYGHTSDADAEAD